MSRLYFFATASDLLPILDNLEKTFEMKYVEDTLLRGCLQIWKHAADIHTVGVATADQEIACTAYLVMGSEAEVAVTCSSMSDDDPCFVYPNSNPDSVLVRFGGFWRDGALISGHFIASSDRDFPRKLMSHVRRQLKKRFTKVQAFWVGPEALIRLRIGKRLCTAIQSPPEYDLLESLP